MFCSTCGAKAIDGAHFCQKCGAELKVDNAGSVTAEKSVRADLQKPVELPESEVPKSVENENQETLKPDKSAASEAQKPAGATEQAVSEIRNTVESVSEGDIYDLLWKSAVNRPEIKKVDYQQKAGITMLKGKRNRYFVGGSGGKYKLSVSPKFPLSIHRIIFWITIVLTVTFLVKGLDLEEIYPLLGWCLLIGGVGGIVSEVICRTEKKEIVTFIKEVLSKAVCVKEPVSPIFEPLSSHPGLWFIGFSLPVASVIEPIIYSLAALAGAVLLIFDSGVLDNTGFSGYNEPHYDTYDDEPETDRYMSSSDTENVLLEYEYINEEEGFSFMYPYNWEIEDVDDVNPDALVSVACTGMLGTYARITVEKDIDDGFCFDATEVDFEEVFSATEGLSNVKVMDLSDIELDGYPARKLTTAFNNDAGVRVIGIQYFYSRGSYLYVVNCAVEEYNYDSYEPRFDAIMDSYTITAANEAAMSFDTSEIVNIYEGSWSGRDYDRLYMEIRYVDANGGYYDISISWSSSASEWTQWELWGAYIEEDGGIEYDHGEQIEYAGSYETGEIEEEVVSEEEEGFLWIGDDGLLYWNNYAEPSGDIYVLEKMTY